MKTLIKYLVIFETCFININLLIAQSRLVFSNTTTYMVMRDGVFLVIDNPNGNAIVPNAGRIVSENEINRIRWYIGGNTGTYTIPFADNAGAGAAYGNNAQTVDAGTPIPFTLQISTGGAGAGGFIDFSTYDGPNWDNNTYRPSMVTHMAQFLSPNAANHSAKAIDRFWVINAQNYSTKPSVGNMTFTYIDNEWTAAGNTFTSENVLGAQRFNNNLNKMGRHVATAGKYQYRLQCTYHRTRKRCQLFCCMDAIRHQRPASCGVTSFHRPVRIR